MLIEAHMKTHAIIQTLYNKYKLSQITFIIVLVNFIQ